MTNNSRVKNSLKNISNSLMSQIISLIANFVVRTIFIKYLGDEYLGVNGLFTNILSILSLAELGFGSAMIYNMYKPLAENNIKKLQAIMNLYKKVYIYIGIFVGVIGLCIIPFMDYIIKSKPNIDDNIILIYIMFLLNSVLSYFFAYKKSILTADQKEYISSQYRYVFTLMKSIAQVVTLSIFKNFILYLLIQIVFTILENIFISKKVNEIYPFLTSKNNETLSDYELKDIIKDVKALIIAKFGNVMLNGTDDIIISSFVGIQSVGMISNYNLIVGSVIMVVSQIVSGLTGSIGNFIAHQGKKQSFKLFKKVDFLNFWIYGFATICLCILSNPFIELWIGESYIVSQNTVNIIAINFYISGMTSMLWMFRSTMGLFTKGKYRPIICALLNILISIILGRYIGLIGVLLGTTISRLLTNLCFDPYVIYEYGFKENVKSYYISHVCKLILMIFIYLSIDLAKNIIFSGGVTMIGFILLMMLCTILPNVIFIVIYKRSDEFKYILNLIKPAVVKLKNKIALT